MIQNSETPSRQVLRARERANDYWKMNRSARGGLPHGNHLPTKRMIRRAVKDTDGQPVSFHGVPKPD